MTVWKFSQAVYLGAPRRICTTHLIDGEHGAFFVVGVKMFCESRSDGSYYFSGIVLLVVLLKFFVVRESLYLAGAG